MGDVQSAQRGDRKDAAAEDTEDKPLKKNRQISETNGKADSAGAQVNAEAIFSPDKDVSKTATSFKGEVALLGNVETNGKESPNEADADEDTPLKMREMDEKQNDINEGFRRFFRNIGLKLTVKKGTAENAEMAADEMNQKEFVEVTTEETESENTEEHTDLKTAQETYDNDSTTCPTLTDATSEDVLQTAEEKTTEVREGVESDNVDAAATSPAHDDEKVQQDATLDKDQQPTSPSSPETEVVVSPIKRFFTTGIFSGLQKKKKPTEDEIIEKELMEIERKDTAEEAEGRVNAQEDKEEMLSAASAQATDDGKPPSTDAVSITVNEPESLTYQEKVQASPLKRLLSGSNLKNLSKKQKSRRSSDSRLSDFGDQFSDHLLSFKESAEHQKEESPAGEEEGAWASFRKLMTPKKQPKWSAETQIPGSVEETKPSDRERISNYSTEEGKKRKDSSVSWDAVLCGSGRRWSRSRKTSDSEDETPQAENDNKKHQSSPESSNEVDESSHKQAGSPSEADGGSTWKSFKKLVTPKRKAKDEEENKDIIQSDNEVTQDDSSFSIKKLLPGRKKSKSSEKQDQTNSDEADKDVASADEDSETPAVVPLSEFDAAETGVHIQTQAAVESRVPKEAEYELQQDLLDHTTEPLLPFDDLPTEIKKVQDKEDTSENEGSTTPVSNEEAEDLIEIISKHQQLSDIPEEGIITETMATPASAAEETARDDTIAEDLIEITSEAITAPEPVDVTLTDETEMISAVSQLSESSKTSGNTTPVPEERDVKQTETLLHQVVDTISMSPKEGLLCSDNPERIVGSVSHQVLEKFLKEEPAILEIHRSSDATAINIGLNVEELDVANKLAVKAQRESVSEVNQSVSKEIVSEVPSVRLDTGEIGVDEVHEVSVSHPGESIKELDSTDDSQETEAVFLETLPEDEEIVADEGSVVQLPQEEKPLEMDSQEAESAATQEEDSMDGGVEQGVQTLTQNKDQVLQNITDQVEVGDKDQLPVEELQEAAMLNSEEGRAQLLEKEIISEDSPAAETHEFKEETGHLTEDNVEAEKEDEPQADDAEAEHVEEPEVLETDQAALLDSEEGSAHLTATETGTPKEESVQSPEEEVPSKDIPTLSGTDETKGETENVAEMSVEAENKELETIALYTDNHQVASFTNVLQTIQEPTPASEEGGVQLLDKEVISETTAEVETVPDELEVETESLVDDDKPVDALETEHAPEIEAEAAQVTNLVSEEDGVQPPEKTDISEPIPEAETFEPTRQPESNAELEKEQPEEDVPEVLLSLVNEVESEAEAEVKESFVAHVATESGEEGHAEEPEKQTSPEDVPEANSINAIASVTEEIQSQGVAELDQALEDNEDQTREITPQDVKVEQEDNVAEAVGEQQTLTAVHVSSVNGETAGVQVRENGFSEMTPPTCVDNAEVTHEPEHEVHLSTVHVSVEGEKEGELPAAEVKNATSEDALVSQVVTCYLKEASAAIPDASMAKTSEIHKALIDTVTSVQELEETVMSATPLVEDEVTESAEEGREVMMTKVPTVQIEDSHNIDVQVVDLDIKSAKTIVDQVLEVGVTETKEVTDVCQETFEEVDHLCATSKTEELINEEKVTVPEVMQHVKEKLPAAESLQNVMKQPDAVTEGAGAAAQQVVEDLTQTFDIPGTSDIPVCNLKEDLDETKPQMETPEADFKTEEVKLPSEELDRKKISEEAQISQMTQSQIVTPSNTGLVVPQNTGIISSVGSVDSPSSISLNLQFGKAKAEVPPQPAGEKVEPVKKTDVSRIGLHAVEPEKEIIPPQSVDSQRQTELTEASVQATEIRETVHSATAERVVVMNQPILLDVGMQAIETVEPVEEIKPTERVTLNVQAAETIQPVRQTEKREVFLSQPVLSEAVQETKTKEPVKPTKEQNEDVWLDAQEEIYTQKETESSVDGAEEPLKTESDQEEETAAPRGETAPAAKTEDEESQEEILKTEASCETESEGEDFAVALEQPETASASVSVSKTEGD